MPFSLLFITTLTPPRSTLFPYTTLFRSRGLEPDRRGLDAQRQVLGDQGDVVALLGQVVGHGQDAGVVVAEAEARGQRGGVRSEEHTSELQSHVNLVCRLLLEKKKKTKKK